MASVTVLSDRFDELLGGIVQDPANTALGAMDIQQFVVAASGPHRRQRHLIGDGFRTRDARRRASPLKCRYG